jgi:16S rRNA processing protein RimM
VSLVRVGTVVRAIGLKGLLGVGGSEGGLAVVARVALRRGEGAPETRKVLAARPQGRVWALELEGITDRTEAERWVGSEVLAWREDLGEAGEGHHYWGDLEGLAVETQEGEALGEVAGLLETGAVDVLVVRGARGELLIPLAPYVTVDREARKVLVDPPEGLLELAGPEARPGGEERGPPWRSSKSRS